MKKTISIGLFSMIICSFTCCHSNKDAYYFNGEIRYIENSQITVKEATSKLVHIEGANFGMMAVYDSLLIYRNPKLTDFLFNVFNIDTGEETGSFCSRGQGPEDANSVNCIYRFFEKENDLTAILFAPIEGLMFEWNISQSIRKGATVYDTIVPYDNRLFLFQFQQSGDTIFTGVRSRLLSRGMAATPFYEKRTLYTDEFIRDYHIYKQPFVRNSNAGSLLDNFFYTWDILKPDGSKIAQAMRYLPQINILDTSTGEVIGFRRENRPDFSLLGKTDMKSLRIYYYGLHADDNYVYASYIEKKGGIPNTIHVFDWNGTLLYELKTDRPFYYIWLDQVRNRLYTTNFFTDEVYYLDLDELL